MKKRILFVIDSLRIGGGERSLVTLLSLLDYSKYDVDLQLFARGGAFEQFLPKEVNVLPLPEYYEFLNKGSLQRLLTFDVKKHVARWRFSISLRRSKQYKDRANIVHLEWKAVNKCIPIAKETYDVAIAYSQGMPTMYVVDKVNAKRKVGWVNVIYRLEDEARRYMSRFYESLDIVNAVSEDVRETLAVTMPECKEKMVVVRDIVSEDVVKRMSTLPVDCAFETNVPIIMTASRLNKEQKGFDITLDAARILHERGVKFHWYVLGRGEFREEMDKYIAANHLEGCFSLLGAVANPYPYMKAATLYVQTSRFEGYGLSIAEVRMLNVPVVTTAYEGVYMQMISGKNGVVVPIDANAVADAVEELLNAPEKREVISQFQRTEKKGNTEELDKFYKLIIA